jgi:hypothetical protein
VQQKGCAPGPTVRMRWLLKQYFKHVINTCEHCTTKLCSKCLHPDAVVEPLQGLQRVRGLRKCNKCGTIFGRDHNASTNIGYNGVYFCVNGKWMRIFTRAPAAAAANDDGYDDNDDDEEEDDNDDAEEEDDEIELNVGGGAVVVVGPAAAVGAALTDTAGDDNGDGPSWVPAGTAMKGRR